MHESTIYVKIIDGTAAEGKKQLLSHIVPKGETYEKEDSHVYRGFSGDLYF